MSPRDPSKTQSDFPILIADLIRELTLIGAPIGLLDFESSIQPVFLVGSRGLTVVAEDPVFTDGEVFENQGVGVTAASVLLDTGQLVAGDYDIIAYASAENGTGTNDQKFTFKHQNAADTVTLSRWDITIGESGEGNAFVTLPFKFSFKVAQNERFRWDAVKLDANLNFAVQIMIHRRPDTS